MKDRKPRTNSTSNYLSKVRTSSFSIYRTVSYHLIYILRNLSLCIFHKLKPSSAKNIAN